MKAKLVRIPCLRIPQRPRKSPTTATVNAHLQSLGVDAFDKQRAKQRHL